MREHRVQVRKETGPLDVLWSRATGPKGLSLVMTQREGSRPPKPLFHGNFLSPILPLIHSVLGFHYHLVVSPVFTLKRA